MATLHNCQRSRCQGKDLHCFRYLLCLTAKVQLAGDLLSELEYNNPRGMDTDYVLMEDSSSVPHTMSRSRTPVSFAKNDFAGKTIGDVEKFMNDFQDQLSTLRTPSNDTLGCNAHTFVVIDQDAIQRRSCIVFQRIESSEDFQAVRLAREEAYMVLINIEGNMDFEEYVDPNRTTDDGIYDCTWPSFAVQQA